MTSDVLEAGISQVEIEIRPPEPIKPGTEGELEATQSPATGRVQPGIRA